MAATFSTYGYRRFEFLAVGDVQIGAGEIERDTEGWADTFEKAVRKKPLIYTNKKSEKI